MTKKLPPHKTPIDFGKFISDLYNFVMEFKEWVIQDSAKMAVEIYDLKQRIKVLEKKAGESNGKIP